MQDHFGVGTDAGLDGLAVARAIGGKHQAGGHSAEHVAQLGKVLADQGVGRRHRHKGHARQHATHGQQGVLDAVFGQDDDGALVVQPPVDQALGNGARGVPGLCVADGLPVAPLPALQRLAPRHKDALGCVPRPVLEPVGQAQWRVAQGLIGLDVAHPRRAVAVLDAGHAKGQRAVGRLTHGCAPGFTRRELLRHGLPERRA